MSGLTLNWPTLYRLHGERDAALAEVVRLRERLAVAQFVAVHWRDWAMSDGCRGTMMQTSATAHPLALVLAALDGETDPTQLGLDVEEQADLRALLDTEGADR